MFSVTRTRCIIQEKNFKFHSVPKSSELDACNWKRIYSGDAFCTKRKHFLQEKNPKHPREVFKLAVK